MTGAGRGKLVLVLLIAASGCLLPFDLGSFLGLETLKARQSEMASFVESQPLAAICGFFLVYVAVTALSPGAAVMTLAAGAVFGLLLGTLLVSFASVAGASLAFLSSRYLFRDVIRSHYTKRIEIMDRGIAKDGAFYLLTLRLIPVFPFFLINLAIGLTAMRVVTFAFVSQIGMLPSTIVYVNPGTQLAAIESTGDILSPGLIGSIVLLATFPLIGRALIGWRKRRRRRSQINSEVG